jgi:hypothetical protein
MTKKFGKLDESSMQLAMIDFHFLQSLDILVIFVVYKDMYLRLLRNAEFFHTGYIPRSQEYFGRPYVETTNASLASFQSMLKSKNQLPPRVQAIKDRKLASSAKQEADITQSTLKALIPKPPVESKTYVSGYTGYVPRLQNYFGVVTSINLEACIKISYFTE